MKRSTLIIIVGLVISLIVVPLVVITIVSDSNNNQSISATYSPPKRSDKDIINTIKNSEPKFKNEVNEPTFKLDKVKKINDNWYIAWINGSSKLLINDPLYSSDGMRVLIYPDSSFDKDSIYSMGIPENIYKEFVNAKN